jgi:hypothetical protein
MELLHALLNELFGKAQAGGTTVTVSLVLSSPTHCSRIDRYSTCGGDVTRIRFDPPILIEEALLRVRGYTEKGEFTCK